MDSRANIILVPLDFSEQSFIALEQASNLAQVLESELLLLNVITTSTPIWSIFTDREQKDIELKLISKLQNLAEEMIGKTGLKITTLVEKGKVADTILSVADLKNTIFIVLGTNTPTELKSKISGTFATRIIKESRCPVITFKGRSHRSGYANILLPLDLTKVTTQKVGMAIWLGKYFKSAIHAVTVTSLKDEESLKKIEEQLLKAANTIEASGVQCTLKIISLNGGGSEKITEALLMYGEQIQADLIMIMTQQEFNVKKFFVGSLATEIMNRSEIPVMSCIPIP